MYVIIYRGCGTMDFKKKVVLITGASYGIGKACAIYFANLGSDIIITYNKSQNLSKNVEKEIKEKYGIQVDSLKCDISCEDDIKNVYDFVKCKYGKIDILINNAALSLDDDFLDKSTEDFIRVLEVNVIGTFMMMKYFRSITNYIFNISSTDAIDTGSRYNLDYCCSKASINCLTKYLGEFDKDTKYISICPNWVDTEPIKEMDQEYLKSELKRIKQDKLINPKSIPIMIKKCIINNVESGSIIRIDGDINE